MSYADQPPMSTRKLTTIIIVFALHAVVLFLMITGGYKTIVKHVTKLTVLDITPPPPPPPLPPPPPPPPTPPQQQQPPPMVTPPAIVQTPPVQAPVMQSTPIIAPAPPTPVAAPVITPPAPPPGPPAVATPLKTRTDPSTWITSDDYPADARRDGVEGPVSFTLNVGTDGRVTGCAITKSSGSASLDAATCRLLPRRARFSPAKDAGGTPIATTFSRTLRWTLKDE